MPEVSGTARADVSHVVSPLLGTVVPVELPGHQRAGGPDVPLSESLLAEVVMLPAAQDILGDGVEVVTAVLVTVIVVVADGETVRRVGRSTCCWCLVRPGSSGLADIVLHGVLPPELAHVVHHLAVKVCVVRSFPGIRYSSFPSAGWRDGGGPVPEGGGGIAGGEEGGEGC